MRDLVTHYPGIKPDIPFFDDEFNSIPSWVGSDESVQAKYVPRGLIYNHAAGVKTFVWLLAAGADGNEYDDFGIIHGITNHDTDFTPRPVFLALQNTNALFSDTKFDASIEISGADLPALRRQTGFPFMAYGFRSRQGQSDCRVLVGGAQPSRAKFVSSAVFQSVVEEYGDHASRTDRRRER